jgi:hypothetical protein
VHSLEQPVARAIYSLSQVLVRGLLPQSPPHPELRGLLQRNPTVPKNRLCSGTLSCSRFTEVSDAFPIELCSLEPLEGYDFLRATHLGKIARQTQSGGSVALVWASAVRGKIYCDQREPGMPVRHGQKKMDARTTRSDCRRENFAGAHALEYLRTQGAL